jgi:hypothetical protein
MPVRRFHVLLVALLVAAPASASAAEGVEIGMEDERLLLTDTREGPEAVAAWREIGVDVVRLHASWSRVAPAGRRKPRGFRAASHRSRRYRWSVLDRAVRLVRENGMRLMLTVTGPGPVWTSRGAPTRKGSYKPSPREFRAFARAVATRYGDDVDRYLIWNEPNLSISPRKECSRRPRVCVAVSPHIYRALVRAAGPAIERADPGAEIVIGELAPLPLGGLGPIRFLREMACVTSSYEPIRTGYCRGFRAPAADALGHHPHGRKRSPDRSNPNPDSAQMGNLSRLLAVADRLTRKRRIRTPGGRRLPLRLTELGYQTSPPDRFIGVSPAQQARYLQKVAYIAWSNPRVKTVTQYQWHDERVRRAGRGAKAFAGWQSGLHFYRGRPKPALAAFARPFVALADGSGAGALLWGQVRPGSAHDVALERWDPASGEWLVHSTYTTGATGVWATRLGTRPDAPGRYRYRVLTPEGVPTAEVSGAVPVPRMRAGARPKLIAAG